MFLGRFLDCLGSRVLGPELSLGVGGSPRIFKIVSSTQWIGLNNGYLYCKQWSSKLHLSLAKMAVLIKTYDKYGNRNRIQWHASVVLHDSSVLDQRQLVRHRNRNIRQTWRRNNEDNMVCHPSLCIFDRPVVFHIRNKRSASCARLFLLLRYIHRQE